MNWNQIKADVRLLALNAVTKVESEARTLLASEGVKLLSEEKKALAVTLVCQGYSALTANVPVLNATELDNQLVKTWAVQAVEWAFDRIGDILNDLGRAPVINAPELTGATVEDSQ